MVMEDVLVWIVVAVGVVVVGAVAVNHANMKRELKLLSTKRCQW
jgi:hypothetical protein